MFLTPLKRWEISESFFVYTNGSCTEYLPKTHATWFVASLKWLLGQWQKHPQKCASSWTSEPINLRGATCNHMKNSGSLTAWKQRPHSVLTFHCIYNYTYMWAMIVLVQEMDIWKNKHAKNIKKTWKNDRRNIAGCWNNPRGSFSTDLFFGPRNLRHLWIACYPTWRSGDGERGEPRIPGLHPGWLKATPAIYPRAWARAI